MKPSSKRAGTTNRFELINTHGTVRVYTRRHINGCKFSTPDHNHCSCPKWIYSKTRDGKATQKSAGTPSFAEACEQAQKLFKGFDPEISQARAITTPAPGITLEAALARYYSALRARKVDPDYLTGSITPVFDHRPPRPNDRGRRALNFSLLDYLDSVNRNASDPATRVEQVTGHVLDDWASAWGTNDLTSKLWRTVATGFFRWAAGRDYGLHSSLLARMNARVTLFGEKIRVKTGNRCGYFSDEQMQTLYAALPFYRSQTRPLPAHYTERLRAMIDLGRWGGMAVADIVCFSPRVNLNANNVLTYRRHKNRHKKDQIAVVLLDAAVAARLRAIPAEDDSLPDQPMRFSHRNDKNSRGIWRERFQKLCTLAGITEVETEVGRVRDAHPHMLRDTFAIDAILRGVSLENVAKMLGHATIEMTQRAYLFWIEQRVTHCIEDQRLALARVPLAVPVEDGAVIAPSGTLVH